MSGKRKSRVAARRRKLTWGKVLAAIAAFGTVAGAAQLAWDLLDRLRHVLAGG